MAQVSWEEIISSDSFTFIVGKDGDKFIMHSAMVASQSKALDRLANGEAMEAIERSVVWKDVDKYTFIRFSQFAYMGAYKKVLPTKRLSYIPPPQPERVLRPNEKVVWNSAGSSRRSQLWEEFMNLYQLDHDYKTLENNPQNDDLKVFLGHARVYVFAECYGIEGLKQHSLARLHVVLKVLGLYKSTICDFVGLVRYTYENTAANKDALRSLLSSYAACNFEELWKSDGFQQLFTECEDFFKGLDGKTPETVGVMPIEEALIRPDEAKDGTG
ncbi:hypothetical protein PT974_02934 [Cladobotryum mycophilum]|uniref:BTB domain-containing protein n=1 Tax=Cladobotryum mycophilum TaxID=491253 RepID=A0ABR0SZE5_9HYPO